MADYTPIPDTSVDPDAPLTSELLYRLRDNPIAIAEGAPGAPRLRPGAFNSAASTTASNGHRMYPFINASGTSTGRFFACIGSGSVRFVSGQVSVASGSSGSLQILRNNEFVVSAGNGESMNAVVTFSDGDLLTVFPNNCIVQNIQIRTAQPSLSMVPW